LLKMATIPFQEKSLKKNLRKSNNPTGENSVVVVFQTY